MRFSKSKFSMDNPDLNFMSAAEQIYNDYLNVIKLVVMPEIKKEHPLRLRELRVVMSLGYSNATVSATDIAAQLRQDPSTITRSLITLVREGYVMTEESHSDGRSKMIKLTEKGEATSQLCRETLEEFFEKIDAREGLENTVRADDVYVKRIEDIAKRAAFVLESAKNYNSESR